MKAEVNGRPETGQIWATGSQKFALMKGISESLAGRLIPLEFMPLSIYERTGHGLGQTPYLPSPVLVSKLRIPDTNEAWRFIYLLRRLSKSAQRFIRFQQRLFFQHFTLILGEVYRLAPSGLSRPDRLRPCRPCLLPLLRVPCACLSGLTDTCTAHSLWSI